MKDNQPPPDTATKDSLRKLFFGLMIAATLFALVFYARQAREEAQSWSSANDFKQVGVALANFNDTYMSLPSPVLRAGNEDWIAPDKQQPQGEAISSWRYAITPFVAGYMIEPHWDQPWDSADNATWRNLGTPFGDETAPAGSPEAQNTKMFAITGPGTAFGDGETELPHSLDDLDGDTILVVEVRDSGVHWMAPGDFDIRTMPRTINDPDGRGISSRFRSGFHVIFADGAVWRLSHETPPAELEKFFTIEGARRHDRDELLGVYLATD